MFLDEERELKSASVSCSCCSNLEDPISAFARFPSLMRRLGVALDGGVSSSWLLGRDAFWDLETRRDGDARRRHDFEVRSAFLRSD